MAFPLDEINQVYANLFRASQSIAEIIRKIEADPKQPRQKQVVSKLVLAQADLDTVQNYIQSVAQTFDEEAAVLQSKRLITNRAGGGSKQPENKIYTFRYASGTLVGNAVISTTVNSVVLTPDYTFDNIHSAMKEQPFLTRAIGLQPYLCTLVSQPQLSLYVEANSEEGAAPRQGFTVGAIIAIASKLLEFFDRGVIRKAVVIPKKSKYDEVTKLCALLPPQIQVINLLGLVPRPQSVSDAQPRLILCSPSEIVLRNVVTTDVHHLVWDDYDGSDMILDNNFTGLFDVVYRGPARLKHATLIPKTSLLRCRVWGYTRTVNFFDVQPFSLAREVEGLFKSLPAGNNFLFTSQTNAFITGVKVVACLEDVPVDADHLVIAEVPVVEELIRAVVREAFAKIVTFVCQPTTPKFLIHAALQNEGLEDRSPLTASLSEVRRDASPSVPVRY